MGVACVPPSPQEGLGGTGARLSAGLAGHGHLRDLGRDQHVVADHLIGQRGVLVGGEGRADASRGVTCDRHRRRPEVELRDVHGTGRGRAGVVRLVDRELQVRCILVDDDVVVHAQRERRDRRGSRCRSS